MPKVVREEIDNLNAVLTVTIDQESYEPKFLEELKKYKKQASMKGFRKGKTPLTFLKKVYGKPVLAEVVQNMLQEELGKFFEEDDKDYLGQPIANKNTPSINFDPRDLEDYVFKFDVGYAPEFELSGMEAIKTFEKYKIEIGDDRVEEEIERIKKQRGERKEVEEDILDNDMIAVTLKELDGDDLKENGWESTTSFLVSQIPNEEVKKEILSKKKGDTLTVKPSDLEDATEEHLKKHILGMTAEDMDREVGDTFEMTINTVNRVIPGELNQELFDSYLGEGKVNSEEEFKEEIRKDIASFYEGEADGLLFRDIRKDLIESNREQLSLPDEFMKRWLMESNEKNTKELVDRDYERFADNLRWQMITGKLSDQFNIKLEEADIRAHLGKKVSAYMGGYLMGNNDMLNNMIDRLMQDREQLTQASEELVGERIFEHLKGNFAITDKSITVDDFKEVLEKVRAEDAPPPPPEANDEEE